MPWPSLQLVVPAVSCIRMHVHVHVSFPRQHQPITAMTMVYVRQGTG